MWLMRVLLLLAFCCGAFAQPANPNSIGVSGTYRIGPGDVLDVTVFEVVELSKPAVVSPRGTISLPLIEELRVEGLTTLQVEAKLKELYGRNYLRNPQITVDVKEFRSQPISIIGAVQRPGVYQLQGERRLLEVLAMAGGFTPEVGETITVSRRAPPDSGLSRAEGDTLRKVETRAGAPGLEASENGEEVRVSIRELISMQAGEGVNPVVRPHDAIRVAKAGIIYVVGAVDEPGGFPLKDQETMTVLRALSLASGLARHSAPQKAQVIREAGGNKHEIPIRIRDVLDGKAPDLELQANDILYVPDSRAKSALSRGAEAAIQLGTGILIWRR